MQSFLFSQPLNLANEDWLLVVSSFEATNSVFSINNGNNSFSITIPAHYWCSRGGTETINKLQNLVQLRSNNDNYM